MKDLKSKNRILMSLLLCAVLVFTAGGSAVRASATADSATAAAASTVGSDSGLSLETTASGDETASLELAEITAPSAV